MEISYLIKWASEVAKDKGFDVIKDWKTDIYKLATKIALIHSEVSESLEAIRIGDFENFKEELADIVIRIMDLCGSLEIDLEHEIRKKICKNEKRSHKHGGKLF